ncbi:LTV1-like isoform X1 [Spatholobus suberectus]|nr:LTV1-like isoform X1 [Spatholobus suberectus]
MFLLAGILVALVPFGRALERHTEQPYWEGGRRSSSLATPPTLLSPSPTASSSASTTALFPPPSTTPFTKTELGFPDDGYNYLNHLREIKNAGAGSAFFHNAKFKLHRLPPDVKAYDASRLPISEVDGEFEENSMYSVASKTSSIRVQNQLVLNLK